MEFYQLFFHPLQKFNTAHLNDSFAYRLEAPGVQPANGLFDFVIMARNDMAGDQVITIKHLKGFVTGLGPSYWEHPPK